MEARRRSSRAGYAASLVLLTAAYFLAARLGLPFAFLEGNATPVWPPTGIAIAALLLLGPRMWPGVAVGAFLANASIGTPVGASLAIAAGNGAEALVAAAVLTRVGFRPALDRVRDVVSLVGAAIAVPVVSATVGVGSLLAADVLASHQTAFAWLVWSLGDAMGALVVGGVILVWAAGPTGWSPRRLAEILVALALLAVASAIVFARSPDPARAVYPFAAFPFTIWISLRGGRHGATMASLLLSVEAVWGTALGLGPFVTGAQVADLLLLEGFVAAVAVTSLVLAASVAERAHAHAEVVAREDELRAVLEAIPDLMFRIGSDGAFLAHWAPRPEDLLVPPEGFLGRRLEEVLPPELARELREEISLAVATGDVRSMDYRLTLPGVGPTHWEARIARNGPREVVVIARNVTERRSVERGLEESVRVLRETDEDRRRLLARLVTLHEEDRARFAEAVQDDVLQLLTAVHIRLETLRRQVREPAARETVEGFATATELAIGGLRRLMVEMHPPALDRDGLAAAVEGFLRAAAAEGAFTYRVQDELEGEPPPDVGVICYRVIEEAVSNARRHAAASRIDVRLRHRDAGVHATVTDDGVGFEVDEQVPGRLGLAAMRERTEMVGGWCRIRSVPGEGTTVELWLPDPSLELTPSNG